MLAGPDLSGIVSVNEFSKTLQFAIMAAFVRQDSELGKKIQNERCAGLSFLQIEGGDTRLVGCRGSVEFGLTVGDSRSYLVSRTRRKKACDDWHVVCFEE